MKKITTLDLILCAMFVALITVGTFIRIPLPLVPFTMQNVFTMLAGLVLGARLGLLSVSVYIIMGLVGIPVFTQGGGTGYVFQPTFGYLIGFAIAAFVSGYIAYAGKMTYKRLLIANFVGLAIIYSLGTVYCYLVSRFYLGNIMGVKSLLLSCIFTTLPKDILLSFGVAYVAKKLVPALNHIGLKKVKTSTNS